MDFQGFPRVSNGFQALSRALNIIVDWASVALRCLVRCDTVRSAPPTPRGALVAVGCGLVEVVVLFGRLRLYCLRSSVSRWDRISPTDKINLYK